MIQSLYPWNYYILYAAIGLTVLVLIVLLSHVITLLKGIKAMNPTINDIQLQSQLMNIKTTAMQEKKEEDAKKNKWMKLLIPIVLAIIGIYMKDPDLHGVSGIKEASKRYYKGVKDERQFASKIKKALR